jgi:cytochrome P450
MLSPDISKGQYTPSDAGLQGDACLMFVAGTDTTANALVQGSWRLINNPEVCEKLSTELREAIPDKQATISSTALQDLPYLVSFHIPTPATFCQIYLM